MALLGKPWLNSNRQISVPFSALLDGSRVLSLRIDDESWRSAVMRLRGGEDIVRMACCDAPGIMKISSLGRRFFAHKAQPASSCNSNPERPEHLELKAVTYEAVTSTEGWLAEIESNGPDWRADVLATRGKVRVAFEIQLSAQGQAETRNREDRYQSAAVLPWWLVVSGTNSGQGFGSRLRSVLSGSDIADWAVSAREAVSAVLKRIESQVLIAREVAGYLRHRGIPYRIARFCSIPVTFTLNLDSTEHKKQQVIVIGELGPEVLLNLQELKDGAHQNAWGGIVQFVRYSSQIKGFGSTAFFIKANAEQYLGATLDGLIGGKLVWHGPQYRNHVEAAFVWYPESCRWCRKLFARAPFAIAGHLHAWPHFAMKLLTFPPSDRDAQKKAIEISRQFEARVELQLGERWHNGDANTPALQNCPHCGYTHSDTLVSAEDALLWPDSDIDWLYSVPPPETKRRRNGRPGGRWLEPTTPPTRPLPPPDVWLWTLEFSRRNRERMRSLTEDWRSQPVTHPNSRR